MMSENCKGFENLCFQLFVRPQEVNAKIVMKP